MKKGMLASAMMLAALSGSFGAVAGPPSVPKAPPNPKHSRSPEDISARQRKRAEKLARRAAKAAATPKEPRHD